MRRLGKTALALLCFCAGARAAQPAAVSLALPNGRLAVAAVVAPSAAWVRYDDGRLARFKAGDAFDGGVEVREADGVLELRAYNSTTADGQVTEVRLVQSRNCSLWLTLRTPPGMPPLALAFCEADLTRLVLRHPAVRPYLDALLAAIDPTCHWEAGAFALAQLNPAAYEPPAGVPERVSAALKDLDSQDWRKRRAATTTLAAPDAALYVALRVNRAALSPEQRRGVDEALSAYPVLMEPDREALARLTE